MLDGIMVDYYGTETPLNQCCSITVEDSKTLSLSPWDKSLVQEIDRAIQKSDLGSTHCCWRGFKNHNASSY